MNRDRYGLLAKLKGRLRLSANPDLNFESKWIVTVSEQGISCMRPNGIVESLTWDDLEVVAIETTDEGPFVADVFWFLRERHLVASCHWALLAKTSCSNACKLSLASTMRR